MSVVIVVEGDTDEPIARALAADAGLTVAGLIDAGGKARIVKHVAEYNGAARGTPWFVLRDLDHDADCAAALAQVLVPAPSEWMCFRIAVRAIESWLMADVEGLSRFLHVSAGKFPADPDAERNPTEALVNLARRSTRPQIKKDMVPRRGGGTPVGRLYEATIIEFARCHWDLDRACVRSDSLRRARAALRALGQRWRNNRV